MECLDCEAEFEYPKGKKILTGDIMGDHVDVDASGQTHTQLECPECGAILGYLGYAAAIGSSNIRGYY